MSSFHVMVHFPYVVNTTTLGGKELSTPLLVVTLDSLRQKSFKQSLGNQATGIER